MVQREYAEMHAYPLLTGWYRYVYYIDPTPAAVVNTEIQLVKENAFLLEDPDELDGADEC